MVGNDVVDLGDPESRPESLHPRFDQRVFAPAERARLEGSAGATRERWRLWAAKEATFKAARRLNASLAFSPARFAVDGSGDERVVAVPGSGRFQVRLIERGSCIHAVALAPAADDRELLHALRRLPRAAADPEGQSLAVRRLVRERCGRRMRVDAENLEVRKDERIPNLWLRGVRLPDSLSISHHGEWVAFACLLAEGDGRRSRPE